MAEFAIWFVWLAVPAVVPARLFVVTDTLAWIFIALAGLTTSVVMLAAAATSR